MTKPVLISCFGLECLDFEESSYKQLKVKLCYNPLRLETVISLVSSGIDFVNTRFLHSDGSTL